jgi:PD-(D/E)XK nuclease superfamily
MHPSIGRFPDVLDSTFMAEFKACPAKFKLQRVDMWAPRIPSTHLHAGGSFAKGLEVARRYFYEQGYSAEDAEAKGIEALLEFYGNHQPSSFGTAANKTAARMAGALEYYFASYPLNHQSAYPITLPGGKKGIEFSFLHPLPIAHPDTGEPLQICGRADGIFHFAGGTYIFDEKTASQLGATWAKQWKLRAQFSGYCWAAQQAGIKVDGVVTRGIAIYKSDYGTLEDISFRSPYMISTWYNEFLNWVDRMVWCYQNNKWDHNFDHACSDFGGCQFQDICDAEDPIPWLERSHERRQWDPVTHKEIKLCE